jgi:hypothetical protein
LDKLRIRNSIADSPERCERGILPALLYCCIVLKTGNHGGTAATHRRLLVPKCANQGAGRGAPALKATPFAAKCG